MKKRQLLLVFIILITGFTLKSYGQAPQQFNYQGAARNSNGTPLANKNISLRISILNGSSDGTVQYSEVRNVITNALGLYNIAIGSPGATSVTGTIAGVTWQNGSKYIKVEVDPNNGINFNLAGTAQLLSVPYAMYAGNGGSSAPETVTVLKDNGDGTYTYTSEDKTVTVVNVPASVKSNIQNILADNAVKAAFTQLINQSGGNVNYDATNKTFTYKDAQGNTQNIDLSQVTGAQTITTLTKNPTTSVYTYTNEAGAKVDIDVVGDVKNNFQDIANNPNVKNVLQQVAGNATSVVKYDATTNQFTYTDATGKSQTLSVPVSAITGSDVSAASNKIKLTNNAGAALKAMTIDVDESKLDLANLSGKLNTTQIAAGANNQVLVTDATGKVAWVDKTALSATVIDGTTLEGSGTTADPFKVKDLGIVTAKLADNAVTSAKLADGSVIASKLSAGVGTAGRVAQADATGAVSYGALPAGAVTGKNLTSSDLDITGGTGATLTDVSATIKNNAITTAKIAAGTNNQVLVTDATGKVAWVDKAALNAAVADGTTISGTGTTADPFVVKDLGITTAKLADNAITTAKIAAGTNNQVLVTDATGKVAWVDKTALAASVADLTTIEGTGTTADPFKVKDLGIVEGKLANDAVTTLKIKDANVTTTKIAAGTNNQVLVTDATGKVAWVDKTALAASVADLTTIEGTGTTADPFKVKDLGIVEAKLANDAVTTLKIKDANVTTGKIAAGTNNQVLVTDATGKVAWVDKTALAASVADLTTIEGTGTTADPFKVKDLGIVEAKLANDAVTTLKIKDANVTTDKIKDANVTTGKIAAGTNNQVLVTDATGKVAWVDKTALAASVADLTTIEGTGTTADPFKVKDLGIVEAKLANDAVTTLKIKDANVTTGKIAAGTNNQVLVTDATGKVAWVDKTALAASVADLTTIEGTGTTADPFKVKDLGIVEAKLANDAVTTLKIKDANVTTGKIAAGTNNQVLVTDATGKVAWVDKTALAASVADLTTIEGTGTTADPFKVKDLGIVEAKLANDAVTTLKIKDANVTTDKIKDANVTTGKIAAGTNNQVLVTDATGKVAWVDKTALAASVADLTTIEGTGTTADPFKVKDLGIVEAKLANDAVTTLKIKDANVTTGKIAAGTNNQVLVTDATGKVAWVDKTALAASVADLTTIEGTGTTADPFKVKDLGIVEAKLANDAVTTLKIKDANVTTGKIAAGTNNQVLVTDATGKVAWVDKTALAASVADLTTIEGTGTTADPFKVKDLGIVEAKLANDAVTTLKIKDANVTTGKIAAGTNNQVLVTDATGKVAWVDKTSLAASVADLTTIEGTGTTADPFKVKDLGIVEAKLANNAVTTLKIKDANVTTSKIAAGTNNQVLVTDATGKVAWVDKTALAASVADLTTIEGTGTTADPFKVKDLGIVEAKLANDAVTTLKIKDANVTTAKLADNAVTTAKITDANVTTTKIAAGTNNQVLVTDATGKVAWVDKTALAASVADLTTIEGTGTTADPFKVKDLGIVEGKLANDAVTTLKIKDANVTTGKIAAGTNNQVLVTDATGKVAWVDKTALAASVADLTTIEGTGTTADPFKVKDLGIVEAKLANDAVTTLKIKDANVTTTKIAAGTNNQVLVTDATGKVAWVDKTALAASVADLITIEGTGTTADPFKVKDLGIVEAKLANDAVTTLKIKDANVTTGKIAAGANNQVLVTDATGKVAWVDKTALAASVADLTTIEGTGTTADPFKVKDLGIVEGKLANDAVTTLKIKDVNVTTAKLADNAVTTAKITDANVTTTKIAAGTNNQVLVTDATGKVAWVDKTALAASVADLTTIEGTGTTADPFKVKDLGIVEAKLANDAVTTLKIKDANVTTDKIKDANVTTGKIAAGTNNQVLVTDATGKVVWVDKTALAASVADLTTIEGTGTTADPFKVKDLGIVEAKLANDAVTTLKIKDANVTTGKIAAGTNNQVLVTDATGKVAWVDKTALAASVADLTTIEGTGTTADPFKVFWARPGYL